MDILIVEDDESVARSFVRILSTSGHTVRHVATVEEGLAAIRLPDFKADVLLLDRQVFGKDGWSLKEHAPPGVRVVLMTGEPPNDAPPHFLKGTHPSVLLSMISGD